jgi:ribosome-binding factor A
MKDKDDNYRDEKIADVIRAAASEYIQRESNKQSMITVTNVMLSKDFKKVTIFVTVLPEHKEDAVIDFLKRNRPEFKSFIKANSRLTRIPMFDFAIDAGEKSRQRIDEISRNL